MLLYLIVRLVFTLLMVSLKRFVGVDAKSIIRKVWTKISNGKVCDAELAYNISFSQYSHRIFQIKKLVEHF